MAQNNSYIDQVVEAWEDSYKKGLLTLWILLSLKDGDKHVQQIKQYIEVDQPTNLTVDEKSLYRSVSRFKKMDLITARDVPSESGGPPLKLYSLTPVGSQALEMFVRRNITEVFLTDNFKRQVQGETL